MQRIWKNIILLIFITSVLSSCYTLGTIEFEVIKPARIIIPNEINSLVVVNNSLLYPEGKFKNDIQKAIFKLDTTTTQYLLQAVNQIINESPRFEKSTLINDIYYRNSGNLLKPISWNGVEEICKLNNADAMISLEAFGIKDTIVRMQYYDGFAYTTYSNLVLLANSMWRIYIPATREILVNKILRDTLHFKEIRVKEEYFQILTQSGSNNNIAKELALSGAPKISDIIAPFWQPVARSFFIYTNQEMKKAAEYAYHDNWIEAAKIWKKNAENDNPKLAGAACYNMAIVCEIEGQLEIAKEWLIESLELYNNEIAKAYLKEINQRLSEIDRLNKQFGVE